MLVHKVFAQGSDLPNTGGDFPGADIDIPGLVSGGINIFLGVVAVAAFASLIYSGFIYITAGGDAAQATKARKNILWALIAIVVALTSYLLVRVAADLPGFGDSIGTPEDTSQTSQDQSSTNPNSPAGPIDDIIE